MTLLNLVVLTALCVNEAAPAEPAPQRLSLAAATARVAALVRAEKPQAKLGADFAVVELTTDAVWDRLKVQVVKIAEVAVEGGETFVLHGDSIIRIGRSFGGDGVTTLVVADLAGDKRPVLVYAFAWGSGEHRSEIGLLDPHAKEVREVRLTPTNFSMEDYQLRPKGEGVEVLAGKAVVGHITAARDGEVLKATIKLDAAVPRALLEQFR